MSLQVLCTCYCVYTMVVKLRAGVTQTKLKSKYHHLPSSGYKWKNNFYEMKGDVGMSLHEKERNKKMLTPRHKVTHNPVPTSLFCFNMLFVCLQTAQHLDIQLKMYVVVLEETKM